MLLAQRCLMQSPCTTLSYVDSTIFQSVSLVHVHKTSMLDGYYFTPLLAALYKEHPNIALLLERDVDVESRGRHLRTALYVASSRGCVLANRP